jgi:hypothetical protein
VERPAVLAVRRYGQSKLKTLRVIRQHVCLLGKLLLRRQA